MNTDRVEATRAMNTDRVVYSTNTHQTHVLDRIAQVAAASRKRTP